MYIFPKVITTAVMPKNYTKNHAIADVLCAWGCVMAGAEQPENFGKSLVLVAKEFNIEVCPEGIQREFDKLKHKSN